MPRRPHPIAYDVAGVVVVQDTDETNALDNRQERFEEVHGEAGDQYSCNNAKGNTPRIMQVPASVAIDATARFSARKLSITMANLEN